jgi:hypothetical protein
VLGKTRPESFSHFGLGGVREVKHPCRRREIGNGLQVPNDE